MCLLRLGRAPGWVLPGLCGVLWVACSPTPSARSVTGPDGSPVLHVSCGVDQATCFELAGRACPNGYYYAPILDPHDNNFFVRCRVGETGTAIAASAGPPTRTPVAVTHWPAVAARTGDPSREAPSADSMVDFGY
jgi:hypothetical protein